MPEAQANTCEKMPRLSAELFVVPVDHTYLVYAPLRQAAFLANAATVNAIADIGDGQTETADPELVELLRRLEIVDGKDEIAPITTFEGDPKPTTVTLFLTTACNLRCTYCYAAAGDTPKRTMRPDVAKSGIDFVLRNAIELRRSSIEIAYHGGGEPTLNWRTLTESLDYAKQRAAETGMEVHAGLATNGVISDEKITWIVENLDSVSLSFDGLPVVHDTHRLTVSGQGSSSQVINTIRSFDEAAFPYGLRLTVTRDQIAKLPASIEFICENFHPARIQVEPSYQLGRWKDAPSSETADFIANYRKAQQLARKFGRQIEFSGARVGTLTNHFCGITQDSFCLTAEGHVSACYETFMEENEWSKTFFYGKLRSESGTCEFNLPVLNNLRRQTVDQRPFCQGCFAKWSCGGDCFHKSLTVNGDGEFRGSDRCHIIRELTKDQILAKIRDSGTYFWHEPRTGENRARGKEVLVSL